MAFASKIIRQAMPTGLETTVDFTSTGFGTPQIAIFEICPATADETYAGENYWSWGATDGTRDRCCGGDSEDAAATSNVNMYLDLTKCVKVINAGTPTVIGAASFNSWITDGVRLDIDTTFTGAWLCKCTLIKGCNNVRVDDFLTGTTQDVAVDVTDPGFEPKALLVGSAHTLTTTTTSTTWYTALGVVTNGTGGVLQAGYTRRENDNAASCTSFGRASASYAIVTQGGSTLSEIEFGSFDASGFSATPRNLSPSNNSSVIYVALDFDEDAWCGAVQAKTSTGTQAYTGPGFEPQFLYSVCTAMVSLDSKDGVQDGPSQFSIGTSNTTTEICNGIRAQDGAGTMNTAGFSDDVSVSVTDYNSDAELFSATVDSFDASGWTWNFATAGSAYYIPTMAIEAAASGHAGSLVNSIPLRSKLQGLVA